MERVGTGDRWEGGGGGEERMTFPRGSGGAEDDTRVHPL